MPLGGAPGARGGAEPPADLIEKAELFGEWLVQSTVVAAPPLSFGTFEGLQAVTTVVRWEVQEHHLVGHRAYDVVRGRDTSAAAGPDDAPTATVPGHETGELPPGTTCFDAGSGEPLPCLASPAEGEPVGFAGRDGVVCKDPEGVVIECFPFRGEPVFVYAIREHVDIDEGGRIDEGVARPWADRRYMRVDWSSNLARTPETSFTLDSAPLDGWAALGSSLVGEGAPDGRPIRVRVGESGHIEHLSFVASVLLESYAVTLDELPGAPVYAACLFEGNEDVPCDASDLHVRTTLLRAPTASEYEPTRHDAEERRRFPLYAAKVRRYDPFRGELESDAEHRPIRFDLWRSSWQRDASGSFVRDDAGDRVPLPFSEREVREVRYSLTGAWPSSTIPHVEAALAQWDAILREAVAFRVERDVAKIPSVLRLSFNGRKKAVASEGLEDLCAELGPSRGTISGRLSSGGPACVFVDHVPTEDEPWKGRDFEMVDAPEAVVARVGDLEHHVLNWVETDFPVLGLFGYGPSSIDPRTGEILQASAHLFGPTIERGLKRTVDAINALNGFSEEAGLPPSADLLREGVRVSEPTDVSARVPLAHRAMPIEEAAAALLGDGAARRLEELRGKGREALPRRHHGDLAVARVLESEPAARAAFDAWGASAEVLSEPARHARSAVDWARDAPRWRDAAGFEPCGSGSPFEDTLEVLARRFADAPIVPGDAAWRSLRDQAAANVLLHELGHHFGLRHNFQGSHDALNYADAYWQLRRESLRPAEEIHTVEDFVAMSRETETQRSGGMGSFASSSIMDYHSSWVSPLGVGRFDRAAVLHSYAEAAEVFDWEPSLVATEVASALRADARRPDPTAPSFARRVHYSQIPYALGAGDVDVGLDRLRQRRLEPWEALRARIDAGDEAAPLLVPYEACSDGWLFQAPGCHQEDRGADEYETARALIDAASIHYLLDAFREEEEFNFALLYARPHLIRLAKLQSDHAHGLAEILDGRRGPLAEAAWAAATSVGFDFAARLGTTPSYGSHVLRDGAYLLASEELGQGDHDIVPGVGRREFDRTVDTGSPSGFPRIVEYGHAWTRWFSLRFLASQTPIAPLREDGAPDLVVSYDLLFPEAIDGLLAGFFLQPLDHAPRVAPDGILEYPDLKLGSFPEGIPVAPNVSFEQRKSVLVAAYGLLRDGQTLRFAERQGHVFLVGTSEEVEPGPGQVLVAYTDPTSGLTYGTLDSADAGGSGMAARYLVFARGLRRAYDLLPPDDPSRVGYAYSLASISEDMDFLRTLYRAFANVDGG